MTQTQVAARLVGVRAKVAERFVPFALAAVGAVALAFAFPKVDQPWLAFVGLTALFYSWQQLSPKSAFAAGWLGGTIFFWISFSWFGYTVGSLVGGFSFALVLVPAAVEGLAFAAAGAAAAFAHRRAPLVAAALASAAAFTAAEWARSIGSLGLPLAQIGYTQVATPFAVFAAYVGAFGVTFIVASVASLAAAALAARRAAVFVVPMIVLACAWGVCWQLWPARRGDQPVVKVAAVQGNVAQSVKWNAAVFEQSLERYSALSADAARSSPALIMWPETSVTTFLDSDPRTLGRLSRLAASLRTTLIIGTLNYRNEHDYNSLYLFAPDGSVRSVYDKRQLVPFVEKLPARSVFGRLPGASLVGRFESGQEDTVWEVGGIRFAPLICWESAFADRAHAQQRDGAQAFLVATDDAWFGETSGPFQHAEVARMRAIESGAWILRAAQTGISGIIRPDGSWSQFLGMSAAGTVTGALGRGTGSVFAAIGPTPIGIAVIVLYAVLVGAPFVRKRSASR